MFAHLHCRSWFSFLCGGASPEALAQAAAARGQSALALTDWNGVYGVVRFQKACRAAGVRPIVGAEVVVDGAPLVLLCEDLGGYANLCRLLTAAHLRSRQAPGASFDELAEHAGGLFCLTGTAEGLLWRLVDAERPADARAWVGRLKEAFGERLSVELAHPLLPGARRRIARLAEIAAWAAVPPVATGDVRYATAEEYRRYDLLTCIRLGLTVFDAHAERPKNDAQRLVDEAALRRRIPVPAAFARAAELADACRVDLLPGEITPPAARLPKGLRPRTYLRRLCRGALPHHYPPGERAAAEAQLRKELAVIEQLDLDEFFLVVHEVVDEARRRGIRCAGRGSAANSIVAYLLGITAVDPLRHHLLFERFLHGGRRGTPDIDVDFDAERRDEVIAWMEDRFGIEQTAMTATVVEYRLRSALRDAAKALGWPMDDVNALGKAVPHARAGRAAEHRVAIEAALGPGPLVDVLVEAVAGMEGCPRHLGLHSGGMVLSRKALPHFTPVQVSANGVKEVQFDKDDVEALGLVKLDVLGLRMLAVISEAAELVARHEGRVLDLRRLPLDDVPTFNLIRSGRVLGCFQIESQGQLHLLAQHQPETFDDLVTEVALFRPGPLQANMVHPFVRRRRGEEPPQYDHPDLEPILRDTYGVILFQEQVLEVAHRFAGMPLEEADEFRRLMSKFRDPGEMEGMRGRFVGGAVGRGVPEDAAVRVFEVISKFVGYGFCRSHAAAFAQTVYHSCYLKRHHPAAYMAAVMQHRPGMYSLMTLEEDARRFGVQTLPPDVARSGVRYDLEAVGQRLAIRKPLTAVRDVSADSARALVWERVQAPFSSVQDLYERVAVPVDALRSLAQGGALDGLAGSARAALWELGVLERRLGPPGRRPSPALFVLPALREDEWPDLPELAWAERLTWDLETHGAARVHPMTLVRRSLTDLEIRPIAQVGRLRGALPGAAGAPRVTTAGVVMLRQRPPTAKGVAFVTIEDETDFLQCVVRPEVIDLYGAALRHGALIVRGRLHGTGNWRGLVVEAVWPLNGIFGGYEGHLNQAGGRDRFVTSATVAE